MENDVLTILRRTAPQTVRCFCGDDDYKDIAVPSRRRKWGAIMDAINKLAWTRLELLNGKGQLLTIIDNDAYATSAADLGTGAGGPTTPVQVNMYLELMLRAQREALTFRDKETHALLAGVSDVLKVTVDAMKQTTMMYQAQVEAAAEIAAAQAGGDIEGIVKLIEASPKLAPILSPLLGRLLGSGKQAPAGIPRSRPATPPTNGASGGPVNVG